MNEPKKKASVFIAILTLDERDGWLAPGMAQFLVAMSHYSKERAISLQLSANKKPVDFARNSIVKEFLTSGYDWMLTIDNDMAPPPNLLDMVDRAEEHMRILVPKFYTFSPQVKAYARNPSLPLILMWNCLTPQDQKKEWRELESAGTGAMFIHREVLDRLPAPWFRSSFDEMGATLIGEDLKFCLNARTVGFSTWGNQNFEVDHFKTVSLSALARSSGVGYLIPTTPPPGVPPQIKGEL